MLDPINLNLLNSQAQGNIGLARLKCGRSALSFVFLLNISFGKERKARQTQGIWTWKSTKSKVTWVWQARQTQETWT